MSEKVEYKFIYEDWIDEEDMNKLGESGWQLVTRKHDLHFHPNPEYPTDTVSLDEDNVTYIFSRTIV